MDLYRAPGVLPGLCVVFVFMWSFHIAVDARRTSIKKLERLSPPLDLQMQTVNCTAIRVQWRMPHRHVSTASGYKVFYTEMRRGRPVSPTMTVDVPLNPEVLATGQFDGQASFDVMIGKLKVATQYRVSVGTYGWAGEGRPSTPRDVSTASHEICMPPSPPTQPLVVAVSDTELALSWQQWESEGTAPVLYFLVAYIRPEMDTEWTYIREPVESNSMVLKGLVPETEYQFVVRSVNVHGISPPSSINNPVRTLSGLNGYYPVPVNSTELGPSDMGSGDYDIYNTNSKDKYDFGVDDADYDIIIKELKPFPAVNTNSRRSQLRAYIGTPVNRTVMYRMLASRNTPDPKNIPTIQNSHFTSVVTIWTTPAPRMVTTVTTSTTITAVSTASSSPNTTMITTSTPRTSPIPTTSTTTTAATSCIPTRSVPPITPATPSSSVTIWKGAEPRVFDTSCDETVCPHDSFCLDNYRGGSRCHCNLGRQGDLCSEVVAVRFPRFYGYSQMTFEPLKHSYQRFHITVEFKADSKDGLLLYCGEHEHGHGDFTSLALIGGKLHYRFNCGTGAAHIVSQSSVVIGQWHIVSLFREGLNGWLQLDNDTPVSGRSQGQYTKITFRTPLYVGGAPTVDRLVRTVGINHGFRGCVQSLLINSKSTDLRPWPHGNALSGADIGECNNSVCDEVNCVNGGVCFPTRADSCICLCPLGFRGDHCEEGFVLSLPQFNASLYSYISAPWPQSCLSCLSFMEFDITFQPASPDGALLYSDDAASADFLSVRLVGGYVELRFDCGSGVAVIRSEKAISMNTWHELHVSRTAKNGILQVDNQPPVEGNAEGAFTQIRCSSPLYIGGVPDYDITKSNAGVLRAFSGAIQKITLNDHAVAMTTGQALGVNVENALHPCVENPCVNGGTCHPQRASYDCDCVLGYDGKHCQKECGNYCLNTVTEAIEIPQFTGRSYLTYDNPHILRRVSGSRTNLFMRFKSTSKDGMLLWRGEIPLRVNSDYLALGLQNGSLIFSYNLGSGSAVVEFNGTFSDGKWHRVKAVREGQFGKLTVDDYGSKTGRSAGKMRQLNISGVLYVGGMKEIALHTSRQYLGGLVGCISHFTLSTDYHVALVEDASDGKNINTCTN
ncbi:pikachurin [Electrophorus electricus]|uniref:pikachurin n=1 Tax=Electrophorus electricus TaxID=8005 RepID=UPI0015CFCD39|nr:pikachurin [Electrophorus electricus]